MSVEPDKLLVIARRVLNLLGVYGVTDLHLTYAAKVIDVWQVNVSFVRSGGIIRGVACFEVNAETEEITGMWLDRIWT